MKKTTLLLGVLTSLFLQVIQVSASEPILPYTVTARSGHFVYGIFNNRWLMKPQDGVKRIAITGVSEGAPENLVVPASLDGYEVYGIDESAFSSCTGIKSITIPKTVRFLREGTLNRCKGLKTIVVADDHPEYASVNGAMFDKQKTKLLTVGSGLDGHYQVPDTVTAIGPYAFANCTGLTRVTIPASVTDIGGHTGTVFLGCTSLERIDIPDTVVNIGQKSFQDCRSLLQVTVPPKVTAIPFGLFWRCDSLTSVTLPDGITRIDNYAFAGCAKLKLSALPKKLTTVGAYAFKGCVGLNGLTVPATVTSIGRGAFSGCNVKMAENPETPAE